MAFWLLTTGRTVFGEKLPVLMVADHLRASPTPPSKATKGPIPPELDVLVLACLAKDPAARPRSAAVLSEKLAAIPVAAPWTQDRARAWWKQHAPDSATRPQLHADPAQDEPDPS